MPVVKASSNAWCDYCKYRFGHKSQFGQKSATVTVISEKRRRGQYRSYCNDCLLLVTHWGCDCQNYRECKNRFTLQDQIDYGKEVQGELDGI
jgi:hypothetical protein